MKLPYVSLPNILLGRKAVVELIQNAASPERLAEETASLAVDAARYAGQRAMFKELLGMLGDEPSAKRAAREVAVFLRG